MADVTSIFGGPWTPPPEHEVQPPADQLRDAIAASGIAPPAEVAFDGRIHRFRSDGRRDMAGWYVAFADGIPSGRWGCWRTGLDEHWRADVGRALTTAEEIAHQAHMARARDLRDKALATQHALARTEAQAVWDAAIPVDRHPYIEAKKIRPNGARVTNDGRLVVPLCDADGAIVSVQYIAPDGTKRFHPGGQVRGMAWTLGDVSTGPVYIAEGFATAATIHECTGHLCAIAYNAGNLTAVTGAMRAQYGMTRELVIVADNDVSGTGQRYAEQAAAVHGARVVMPPVIGDANDYATAGHDLRALLCPPTNGWLIPADEFASQPAPISWLIRGWVQANALVMVHGPSGGGKTFVALDWCLHMAAGIPTWMGQRVSPGAAVYLAGEGHHGLRGRVAAWMHHHGVTHLDMWLSRDGCELNDPAGYQQIVRHIQDLHHPPAIIVVDTLHRFLAGDENSAMDAKRMLDACAGLMGEFSCSVLLVHHTGVSDEAQHRARGSSAWRAALDIEISVVPPKKSGPIQLVQRKSKDAEIIDPLFATLTPVEIPGWIDADGEQVTSAVLCGADPPAKTSPSKIEQHRKTWENAWWDAGAIMAGGRPFLSRDCLVQYLIQKHGIKDTTARFYVKPTATGRIISALLTAQIIEASDDGWVVVSETHANAMRIRKSENTGAN